MTKKTVMIVKKKKNGKKSRSPKGFRPFKPIPQSMKVALRSRTYETLSSTASPLYLRYGLIEFLGNVSSYLDSLYGLYNLSIIHGCRITLRLVNTGSEPIILACAPLPYSWITGTPTLAEILDVPKCVRKTCGASTGKDSVVLTSAHSVKSLLGKEFNIASYQMTQAQAASSTPLNTNEPVWVVMLSAFNGLNSISCRLEVEFEFSAEFYSLTST